MGIHDGHRERVKERFLQFGLDSFNDVGALELLLCFAIPRKDTNPIAHELINHFGSLPKVLDASWQELMSIPGVGKNAAALITLIPQMMRKYEIERVKDQTVIKNYDDAGQYLMPRFLYEQEEVLKIICLDSARKIICCEDVSRGVVNSVDVNVRRIVEIALKNKASACIIAHNHPDGTMIFSIEDDHATRMVVEALLTLGIPLIDHILICGKNCISMQAVGNFSIFSGEYLCKPNSVIKS